MRLLWAWYWAWTAADVATTIYLYHAAAGSELNALINTLALLIGFDAATIVAALATTLLLLPLLRHPLLAIAAKSIMVVRFVAPLNNALIAATGLGLADLLALATGLNVYQAYFLLMLMVNVPTVIYFFRKAPPPSSRFLNSSRRKNYKN